MISPLPYESQHHDGVAVTGSQLSPKTDEAHLSFPAGAGSYEKRGRAS